MAIFEGAGVAIITPMHEDGSVNFTKFQEIIDDQITRGTDSIIVCGTSGEASTLSHEEHIDVIRACVEFTRGRVPVIAGTGSNCTVTAVYLSQEAEKAGADGILVVSPYYNKATQKGLIAHFTAVAESVHLPMILYNIPGRTGVNIKPETIVELGRCVPNIVGVKEASGDIAQIVDLFTLADGSLDIYSGNDDQIVPIMSLGGKGVISVLSNVAPEKTHDIAEACLEGDFQTAARRQLAAMPLIRALFSEVNPIPVKAAMNLQGWEVGPLRMPLTEMEPANREKLRRAMEAYGVL